MAQHLSGHFLIESEEEYKKRTGGKLGCDSIILIAICGSIILIAIISMLFDDDNKKSSNTKSPAKTEIHKTVQPKEIEDVVESEIITPVAASNEARVETPAEEDVEDVEEAVDSNDSKTEIRAAKKKVNELFKTIKKACKQKDIEGAQAALDEMVKIQTSTPSRKFQAKITSAKRLIEKAIK